MVKLKEIKQDEEPAPGTLVLGSTMMAKACESEMETLPTEETFDISKQPTEGLMSFKWLLNKQETIQDLLSEEILNQEQIFNVLEAGPLELDCLYLVKWYNLSYSDCTWEPASAIRK